MDILNLCDYDVIERTQSEAEYFFTIRYTVRPTSCPQCNRMMPRLQNFGKKPHVYKDLPIHGKRVRLKVVRARYRCLECKRTFYETLPEFDDNHRATRRFVEYAEKKSLIRTFVSIADELGVSERMIRNIFKDYIKRLEKGFVFETPEWLGIDEIHLLGKYRCVLANVSERTVFDILENRNQSFVAKRLMKMKDRDKIKLVAMDMWEPYKNAVNAVLPQAVIVIDKFHVVKLANKGLNEVRKKIRDGLTESQRHRLMHDRFLLLRRKRDLKPDKMLILETWLNRFPDLKTAYELKEQLFDIWDSIISSEKAKKQYKEWEASIPKELAWAFKELTTAVNNWEKEVFAYFDHRITNAYTESLNGLTKLANRMGRGYSFDVIRAKVLFSMQNQKPKKQPIPKPGTVIIGTETMEVGIDSVLTFGVDIAALTIQLSLPPADELYQSNFSTRMGRLGRRPKDEESPSESE